MEWLNKVRGARMTVQTLIVASVAVMQQSPTPDIHVPMFSDCERQEVVAYWSEPGRYTVGPFIDPKLGAWAVRLPAEASQWFWNYNRARGYAKTPPSQVPPALNAEQETWEAWINEKVAYDRWAAGKEAEKKNLEEYGLKTVLGETIQPPTPAS